MSSYLLQSVLALTVPPKLPFFMVTPIYLFRLINATCRDTLIIEETLYEHNNNLQNKQGQNNLQDFFYFVHFLFSRQVPYNS